jgi:hypothetical protein
MKRIFSIAAGCALGMAVLGSVAASRIAAQDPILAPIVVSEVTPIVVKALTPKPKPTGLQKFQGYIMNSNVAQVTVRAKSNEMAIQTFPLSQPVAAQMQRIIDRGGYQYGDKVTVYYDPQSHKAVRIKGKPSPPL